MIQSDALSLSGWSSSRRAQPLTSSSLIFSMRIWWRAISDLASCNSCLLIIGSVVVIYYPLGMFAGETADEVMKFSLSV